jgi:6-phosphogluconolactonase
MMSLSPGGGAWVRRMRRLLIFALICPLLIVPLLAAAEAGNDPCLVYVGTYTDKGGEGIFAFRFDPATGESVALGLAAAIENPSFLGVDPQARFLYAVNELKTFRGDPTGAVSVLAIDRESGRLKLLQQVSSLGRDPAHVSLDKSGRFLLVANYDDTNSARGNSAVFPIGPDGRLGPYSALAQDVGASVNPERQTQPHPHSIQVTNDNRFVLVADLGLDKLLVYRFDAATGSLTRGRAPCVKADPGAGPRHVAFAPSGKFVYVVNELASTVTVFAFDPGPGMLVGRQTVSTLPSAFAGKNKAAEILADAGGRFLYVSNRGHDSIAVFRIDPETGSLTAVERVPSGGRTPRNFAVDPTGTWFLAANQDSNEIRVFRIDPESGRLTLTPRSLKVVSPACVLPVSLNPVGDIAAEEKAIPPDMVRPDRR